MDRCPELVLGFATYFASLSILVGAVMRLAKRISWLTPDWVPLAAMMVGIAIDSMIGRLLCARIGWDALSVGLVGGLAGLTAAGGHEALERTATRVDDMLTGVGLKLPVARWTSWFLGRATTEKAKRGG